MLSQFKLAVLPHLDAAYNLARWLSGRDHDAQDIVQESYLRAWRAFPRFRGGDSRSWLLTIVRNTCRTMHRKNQRADDFSVLDDEDPIPAGEAWDPQAILAASVEVDAVRAAVGALPPEFKEVLVLRELEGLSYKQVAQVLKLPLGTVMSRLARGRARLHDLLLARMAEEAS